MEQRATRRTSFLSFWLATCLLTGSWLSQLYAFSDVSVVLLDGSQRSGKLMRWGQESLTLEASGQSSTVELRSVRSVEFSASGSERTAIDRLKSVGLELRDGSILFAADVSGSQDRWSLTAALGLSELPPATLAAVQFRNLLPAEEASWKEWRTEKGILDSLIISRSEGVLDRVNGVVLRIEPGSIEFEMDGQKLNPPRTRIVGLILARQPLAREPLSARIGLVDRSEWNATELQWDAQQEVLAWTSPLGIQCKTEASNILRIDLTKLNVRWLSEIEAIERKVAGRVPTSTKFTSRDRLFGPRFARDQTNSQTEHDLIFHSPGEVTFRVPESVATFVTQIRRISGGDFRSELHAEIYHADEQVFRSLVPEDGSAVAVRIPVQPNRRLKLVLRSSSPLAAGSTVEWSQPRFER